LTLVDTDVLIWFLRGRDEARRILLKTEGLRISAVTRMEVVQGLRDRKELPLLHRTLANLGIRTIEIDSSISSRASLLVENHFHSHHLQMADALIAATAQEHGLALLTGNFKNYKDVPGLELHRFVVKA